MKDPAPILRDAWRLCDKVLDRVGTSGDPLARRLSARALDLLEAVHHALHGRATPERVEAADQALAAVRIHLRLAAERGLLTDAQAIESLDLAASVGRQVGGWLRSLGPT